MKKLLAIILFTSLILTACSGTPVETGTSTGKSDTPRYVTYKTSDFTMDVPDTWVTLDTFTGDYPSGLRIAFKNNVQNTVFTANVTVVREDNSSQLTSSDYAQKKLQNHKEHLLNYTLISQEVVTLSVSGTESQTMLNTFSGQNDTDGPTLNFMQEVLTKGGQAWIVTASYRPDEDEFTIEKMQNTLKTFTLR